MALQWYKQPDGTMIMWDPADGEPPLSSSPENGQSTDTTDVAQQIFQDGGRSGGLLGALTAAGGASGGKINYDALLAALLGVTGSKEGDQSVGATTPEGVGYSPAEPSKGEEGKKDASVYSGGKAFVQGMIQRGWTPEEAAGLAGNVHVESGFKPAVKSSVKNEQSYGFMQWNKERLQGLKNYAESKGKDWHDPEIQMDWINLERTGESVQFGGSNEASAYKKALSAGGSPGEIAERFGRFVERPKDLSQSVALRRSAAERYAQFASAKATSAVAKVQEPPPPSPEMAQAKLGKTPYSDQSVDEELFTALLGGGSTSWG